MEYNMAMDISRPTSPVDGDVKYIVIEKETKKEPIIDEHEPLRELCKCPVCFDYNDTECKTCQNGHIVCSSCYKDLISQFGDNVECPLCRKQFINYKQTMISQLYDSVNFSVDCIYDECKEDIRIKDYWEHQKICKFRPIKCIYHPTCQYEHENNINKVAQHYSSQHGYANIELLGDHIRIPYLDTTSYPYNMVLNDTDIMIPVSDHKCNIVISVRECNTRVDTTSKPYDLHTLLFIITLCPLNRNIDLPMYNISLKCKDNIISSTKLMEPRTSFVILRSQLEGQDMDMIGNKLWINLEFKPLNFDSDLPLSPNLLENSQSESEDLDQL
jgi:hypothetical protein